MPVVKTVRYPLVVENSAEVFVVLAKRIGFTDDEYDVHFPQVVELVLAVQAAEKVGRRVEVD